MVVAAVTDETTNMLIASALNRLDGIERLIELHTQELDALHEVCTALTDATSLIHQNVLTLSEVLR